MFTAEVDCSVPSSSLLSTPGSFVIIPLAIMILLQKSITLFTYIFCMHVGKGQIGSPAGMEVRGQPEGISFLLPSCGSQILNTSHQVWWQVPSSTVPPHRPYFVVVVVV